MVVARQQLTGDEDNHSVVIYTYISNFHIKVVNYWILALRSSSSGLRIFVDRKFGNNIIKYILQKAHTCRKQGLRPKP
jgi:hypothetical protein